MALQASIAELTSGERVPRPRAGGQMVDPPAGQTRYLTARPASDPRRAAQRYKPPSERAKAIMANNGMLPGALAPPARRPRSWRRRSAPTPAPRPPAAHAAPTTPRRATTAHGPTPRRPPGAHARATPGRHRPA